MQQTGDKHLRLREEQNGVKAADQLLSPLHAAGALVGKCVLGAHQKPPEQAGGGLGNSGYQGENNKQLDADRHQSRHTEYGLNRQIDAAPQRVKVVALQQIHIPIEQIEVIGVRLSVEAGRAPGRQSSVQVRLDGAQAAPG